VNRQKQFLLKIRENLVRCDSIKSNNLWWWYLPISEKTTKTLEKKKWWWQQQQVEAVLFIG